MTQGPPSPDAIVLDCDFAEPPAQVWRALTAPELVSRWLLQTDIRAEPGHRFQVQASPGLGGAIQCEVLAAEPPERLSYSWRGEDPGLDTVVTFELKPTPAGGTRLRVIHSGFVRAAANSNAPRLQAAA